MKRTDYSRQPWSKRELKLLHKLYPHQSTEIVAGILKRKIRSVYNQAALHKIKKTNVYLTTMPDHVPTFNEAGASHRFSKGCVPFNKGKKLSEATYNKIKPTMFTNGHMPVNHRPVGSERVSVDGYIEIKIAEPRTWQPLHRLVWEETFGPIPKGMNVQFVTKDKLNVHPWNLELRTKAQNMKNNSVHNYGSEIAKTTQLLGALNRQINKRNKP
jgi:hypothetical protein